MEETPDNRETTPDGQKSAGVINTKHHEQSTFEKVALKAAEKFGIKKQIQEQFSPALESAQVTNPKLARSIQDLPPLKDGFIRFIHTTNPVVAEEIAKTGLDYSDHGMISSTARSFSNKSEIEYYSGDLRFQSGKSAILDVPSPEAKLHDDMLKSPGRIPEKYVTGIIDAKRPLNK